MNRHDLSAAEIPHLLLITGQDPYMVSQTCQRLIGSLLNETQKMTALTEWKASEVKLADVLDELRTAPFLSPCRIVLIRDAQPFIQQYSPSLIEYLNNPSPTGYLFLTADSLDKRTKFAKAVQEKKVWLQAEPPSGRQLPAYLVEYAAKTHQVKIDTASCQLLIEWVGDELGRLCRELDKLATYIYPRKTITVNDIQHIVGQDRVYGAFHVIDQLMANNISHALRQMENMFAGDKDAPYTVVGAFAYCFRQLFGAAALMTKGYSAKDAADKMKVFGFRQPSFILQLQRFSLEHLATILSQLAQIDYAIKTGKTDAQLAMERLIVQIWENNTAPSKSIF